MTSNHGKQSFGGQHLHLYALQRCSADCKTVNATSFVAQDLLAQFTNSANAAGQLNSQVSQEVAGTTANIVGSAETAISDAVVTANTIAKQVGRQSSFSH